MKKLISFLASVFFLSSNFLALIACSDTEVPIYGACYDEFDNNVTTKGSDIDQWLDMDFFPVLMWTLSKDIFPNSESFFDNLNDKTSDELIENCFRTPDGGVWPYTFNYNFTFLVTNYESINSDVIYQMKIENLADKDTGTYLFLNLPGINLTNIQTEPEIDFQLIFIIKNSDGTIIGNLNNSWFYWYDFETINEPLQPDQNFFFNFSNLPSQTKRVVTRYSEPY